MTLFGLHIADVCVLVFYLVGITVLGIWAAGRIRNVADFFMPRRFGKAMMVMYSFGTGTHADQAVGVASKSFTNGLSGIWYEWVWMFCTPFYWLIAPVLRRLRAVTMADAFEARYGPTVAMLFVCLGASDIIIRIGLMLKSSSVVIQATTGNKVSSDWAVAVMTVMFVVYGMAGGLSAAIITDFVQGILTIVFSFMLLPFILCAVGGLAGIRQSIGDLQKLSLVAPSEIGIFYIIVISLNALIGVVAQSQTMSTCAACPTEREGRVGYMYGNIVKRICTVAWSFTGLAAIVYFANSKVEVIPDQVFGMTAKSFLPKILPGLVGLFLAGLIASNQDNCASFMLAAAGLFTENLYKRFVPGKTERHYMFAARAFSLLVVAGGIAFYFYLKDKGLIKGLEIFWMIPPLMGIPFWLGLFWRRTSTAGAWAAFLAAILTWWLTTTSFFVSFMSRLPAAEQLRFIFIKSKGPEIYLPWQMIFYLLAGVIAGIVVSLFTKPVSQERLDNFYALVRTPIRRGERVVAPCTLPDDAVVPEKRLLLPVGRLEILWPSRESVIGFLIGSGYVAAIIGSVYLLAKVYGFYG